MHDHAMDYIAWLAQEITTNREHINRDELWYDAQLHDDMENQTIVNNDGLRLFDASAMARVTSQELLETSQTQPALPSASSAIHESYELDFPSRPPSREDEPSTLLRSPSYEDEISTL